MYVGEKSDEVVVWRAASPTRRSTDQMWFQAVVDRRADTAAVNAMASGSVQSRAAIAESEAMPLRYAVELLGMGGDDERAIRLLIALPRSTLRSANACAARSRSATRAARASSITIPLKPQGTWRHSPASRPQAINFAHDDDLVGRAGEQHPEPLQRKPCSDGGEAAAAERIKAAGEAVVLGPDGLSRFDELRR